MATNNKRGARTTQAEHTVKALVPVNYDHTNRAPGDTFEVRAEDLEQLLEVNAVELADGAEAAAA